MKRLERSDVRAAWKRERDREFRKSRERREKKRKEASKKRCFAVGRFYRGLFIRIRKSRYFTEWRHPLGHLDQLDCNNRPSMNNWHPSFVLKGLQMVMLFQLQQEPQTLRDFQ